MRHLNNGTDHRHSKSCCDQSSPARRTMIATAPMNLTRIQKTGLESFRTRTRKVNFAYQKLKDNVSPEGYNDLIFKYSDSLHLTFWNQLNSSHYNQAYRRYIFLKHRKIYRLSNKVNQAADTRENMQPTMNMFCIQAILLQKLWAPSQYPKSRLSVRSRKVSKPRDLYLELSDRSEIWQALRQQCCRCACQISKRYDNLKYQSRGFETLRDLTKRRLFGYWDGAQASAGDGAVM